ncbi:hypothetical protein OVA21_13740 [Dietzia sp. SL131]|uniref:hypothetical protein n=1 Tax=Dietzia sp. SL131 TaxID=2995149 RepID=UPI00227ADB4C|nr:hypothetical protein [Dietzia sp. SL131]MCY1658247.1 hypothetical protein [Dietzia sp. SL131]
MIPESELPGLGAVMGDGNYGEVFLLDRGETVYKRYKPDTLHGVAHAQARFLETLVHAPAGWEADVRDLVLDSVVWPTHTVVAEDGAALGVVMPRIPREFEVNSERDTGEKPRFSRLGVLFEPPGSTLRISSLEDPSPGDWVRVAVEVAVLVAALHRVGIVIGDVSAQNVLVTPRDQGAGRRVMIIDSDSFRPVGMASPVPQRSSEHWMAIEHLLARRDDMAAPAGSAKHRAAQARLSTCTLESDVFKLGLLVVRCLATDWAVSRHSAFPVRRGDVGAVVSGHLGARAVDAVWAALAPDAGDRPTAVEVALALAGAAR